MNLDLILQGGTYNKQIKIQPLKQNILWTDEACFTNSGMFNIHNSHIWSVENPHAFQNVHNQWRFSVNVWAGIVGDNFVGPYLLPARLTEEVYVTFLRETLPVLLEDVPLARRRQMIYQHDGAPAHFARRSREVLDQFFPGNWIGRSGPIPWPARSPDKNPIDYCVWGFIKDLIYETPVESEEDLIGRIVAAFGFFVETRNIRKVQSLH
ncbi:hypothetical protein M8J77_016534 [Diaphorina citri]|nr:hypothetical protein M8J77_016534 [Diaphorina citri]